MSNISDSVYYQAFDLNYTNNVWAVDVAKYSTATVQAEAVTTWTTAIITVQRSDDGINGYGLETALTIGPASTVVPPGMSTVIDVTGFKFLLLKLTTINGSAVYANLTVNRKAANP